MNGEISSFPDGEEVISQCMDYLPQPGIRLVFSLFVLLRQIRYKYLMPTLAEAAAQEMLPFYVGFVADGLTEQI